MRILLSVSAIALAGGFGAANAQYGDPRNEETTGFYLGGGYTYLDVTADSEIESVDDLGENVNALTARAGYQFTPIFSVEVDASFGVDEGDFDFQGDQEDFFDDSSDDDELGDVVRAGGDGDLGVDYLIGVFGRASYPVADRLDVHARAGYAFIEADINARITDLDDDGIFDEAGDTQPVEIASGDGSGFAFGGGLTYDLTEAVQLRADYTRYEFDGAEANAGTVLVEFKFGGFGY